jgi:hypothetical protein
MTDLRKELNVADEQHRDLVGRVSVDETIRQIRYDYFSKPWYKYLVTHGAGVTVVKCYESEF